jgi:hypothetical protein
VQQTNPNWTEAKTWLYQGYEVTHAPDGKSVEIRKRGGPIIRKLSKPVTYEELTAVIDRHRATAR